jgi:hypothetical protein
VKILDMGLARFSLSEADNDRLTATGQVVGTCEYIAPEQAMDSHRVDPRADIYSLGCTMYRILIGSPPYKGDSFVNTLLAHLEQPIPSLRERRPDVPERLDQIFRKMVAKKPEDRYPSMTEVIQALESYHIGPARATAPAAAPVPGAVPVAATPQPAGGNEMAFLNDLAPEPPAAAWRPPTVRLAGGAGKPRRSWLEWLETDRGRRVLYVAAALVGVVFLTLLAAVLFLLLGRKDDQPSTPPKDGKTKAAAAANQPLRPVPSWTAPLFLAIQARSASECVLYAQIHSLALRACIFADPRKKCRCPTSVAGLRRLSAGYRYRPADSRPRRKGGRL